MKRSGMARRDRLDIRQSFGEAIADDVCHLCHEIFHFLPFGRQQVLLQLRVDRPLGFDLYPFSADEHAEQFHVPGRINGLITGKTVIRLFWWRDGTRHAKTPVDRYLQHTVSTLVLYIGGGASRGYTSIVRSCPWSILLENLEHRLVDLAIARDQLLSVDGEILSAEIGQPSTGFFHND